MAVLQQTMPTDAQVQEAVYNQNIGGGMILSASFEVGLGNGCGTTWAVAGLSLTPNTTPQIAQSTVLPTVDALPYVSSIFQDQPYISVPNPLDPSKHWVVTLAVVLAGTVNGGTANQFEFSESYNYINPVNPNVKWMAVAMAVPDEMNAGEVQSLLYAITNSSAYVIDTTLIADGSINDRIEGNATMSLRCHLQLLG